MFGLPAPANPSSPLFPYLRYITVLGSGPGSRRMVKARRYSQKTGSLTQHNRLEGYAGVGGLVDDLRTSCPIGIIEWEARNEIPNIWSTLEVPSLVRPNQNAMALD